MKNSQIKYICVVVTFNRKELLMEAIEALLNQTLKPYKIIIYDNHSTDGSYKLVNEHFSLESNQMIDYIYSEENLGGSAGYHYGLKAAMKYDFDWVALSDDDAIYDVNYFEQILSFSVKHPQYQAFTGTVRIGSKDGEIQYVHRKYMVNKITLRHQYSNPSDYGKNFFAYDIATFVGLVMTKQLVNQIGLPQKEFFIWNDDMEYCLRMKPFTKIINLNSAFVVHKTKLTAAVNMPTWKEYYGFRNFIFILRKYGPNKFINVCYPLLRLLRTILGTFKPKYKGYRKYRLELYIRGYIDGVRGRLGKNKAIK